MLTPEEYLDKYGTKRTPRHIIQTYRIRNTINHNPKFKGSLDHVIYVLLFPKKLFRDPELYIYCYYPSYNESKIVETEFDRVNDIEGFNLAEQPVIKLGYEALEEKYEFGDFEKGLIGSEPAALSIIKNEVLRIIKDYTLFGGKTDYKIIQSPWRPGEVPPEEIGKTQTVVDKIEDEDDPNKILQLTAGTEIPPPPKRARGQYTLQISGEDKLKVVGPAGNLVLFPDGTKIDIGELTLVKQEDPNDPQIITILNPENENFGDLAPEYLEESFVYDEGEFESSSSYVANLPPTEQDIIDIQISAGTPTVLGQAADFWALAAICTLEAGHPQPRADVAQSIYNRLATPGQPYGSSLKAIITAHYQYEPAFIPGGKGAIHPKWKAIKDRKTAVAAIMQSKGYTETLSSSKLDETIAALKDKTLQEEARKLVGTRTEFLAYSPGSSSAVQIKHRSTSYNKTSNGGNNYFFYRYAGKTLIGQNPPGAPDFSNFA